MKPDARNKGYISSYNTHVYYMPVYVSARIKCSFYLVVFFFFFHSPLRKEAGTAKSVKKTPHIASAATTLTNGSVGAQIHLP